MIVKDIPGPHNLCWKQCTPAICRKVPKLLPRVMERCTYKKNHSDGHSWEEDERKDNSPS